MKPIFYLLLICGLLSCKEKKSETNLANITQSISPEASTNYVFSVTPVVPQPLLQGIQAGAMAYSNGKLIVLSGRTSGFHGLIENDTTFNTSGANRKVYSIDVKTWASKQISLPNDVNLLQLSGTNVQYTQDGDTLYMIGGYCRKKVDDIQNNYTSDRLTAISVSKMVSAVENNTDVRKAILFSIQSPIFKTTGGALFKEKGWFYLMFGQVYDTAYSVAVSGKYTESIRMFRLLNGKLTDTSTVRDTLFHRRDLNVARIRQKSGDFFATYGGVFTSNNKGFVHPIYIYPNGGKVTYRQDTMHQISNQYDCAMLNTYSKFSDIHTTVLLGGIGESFYNKEKGIWDPNGDDGNPLPFVEAITQMICRNGQVRQYIQTPTVDPEMPDLIGADAFLIPIYSMQIKENIIEVNEMVGDSMTVGYLFGGIKATKPTSSQIYPTSVNNVLYKVMMYRRI